MSTRRRRGVLFPALFTLVALIVLLALGTWQLDRRQWKEALIDGLTRRIAMPPASLPPRENWPLLAAADMEFRRFTFPAEFLPDQEALVYTTGSSLRPDVSGVGYWVFAPARLPGGSLVVVNRGFVPEGRQDTNSRAEGAPAGVIEVTGAMRWPETRGLFTPSDEPGKNLWFVRDPTAMAQAKHWEPVAPFYIEQETPAAPGGLPKVGPLQPNLANNHLQYAITWFGLALVLVAVFMAFLRGRLRR